MITVESDVRLFGMLKPQLEILHLEVSITSSLCRLRIGSQQLLITQTELDALINMLNGANAMLRS